jgi:predicted PurR-regulated permease PerM
MPRLWGGLMVVLEFIPYLGATGVIILLTLGIVFATL